MGAPDEVEGHFGGGRGLLDEQIFFANTPHGGIHQIETQSTHYLLRLGNALLHGGFTGGDHQILGLQTGDGHSLAGRVLQADHQIPTTQLGQEDILTAQLIDVVQRVSVGIPIPVIG